MELLLTFILAKPRITLEPINAFNEWFIMAIHLDRKSQNLHSVEISYWKIITIASTYISFTLNFFEIHTYSRHKTIEILQ